MVGHISKHLIEVKYKCNIKRDDDSNDSIWIACRNNENIGCGRNLSELDKNIAIGLEVNCI